ncbi:MAG TPA: serine/threonine-protein kinase [Thermoanaerobaculia bacterium]|nr:serine/threonine-protein kinase [Thermoanaerobaculia bacterium]
MTTSAAIGSILEGKYEIVRLLGQGGMGEVFLARHLHLHEERVIKVLRRDRAADPASQQRFLREARLATQIKHPNVAILYDCSRLEDGGFYMVWEHVEGQDLGEQLADQGPFPVTQAVDLAIQALRGLEAIHSRGIVHRDISPDNLMIHRDSGERLRLKIIDLGLAKALGPDPAWEVTQAGTFMGKLRYCSPEQAQTGEGDSLDRRSDLYSLGLVLYEMVSGTFPFEGAGPAALLARLHKDPLPLAGRNPAVEVPAALGQVVERALARDRDDRFADAIAFIEALDDVRRSLADMSTRQVPVHIAPPASAAARSGGAERPRSAELSAEERSRLLAQIDRAARRQHETTLMVEGVNQAIAEGRHEDARRLLAEAEAASAAGPALHGLKRRLAEAEASEGNRRRLLELEAMVTRYIQGKQQQLARLALDSLLEIAPTHPRRGDFESWVALMDDEAAQDARLAAALAAGREALAAGDFRRARRQLQALRRADPGGTSAADFEREIERTQGEAAQGEETSRRRQRFEERLAAGDLAAAADELAWLEPRMSRVAGDDLRRRLEATRRGERDRRETERVVSRFEERLAALDWAGARQVARELAAADHGETLARELFARVDEREKVERRRAALADGELQLDALIARGEADQAELALKILLQIDPAHPRRRQLERQIQGLRTR